MLKDKPLYYYGRGECHWCSEERELYGYDDLDELLCEKCIKNVTEEDFIILEETPS